MAQKVWEVIKTLFWALLIAGVFRTLLFQPFWIPSGSMKDTLLIGDFLFVNQVRLRLLVCLLSGDPDPAAWRRHRRRRRLPVP